MKRLGLLLALPLFALGCEDDAQPCSDCSGGGGTGDGGGTTGAMTTAGSGGGAPAEWTTLITGEWQLESGGENTSDIHQITLDRDLYIGAIRPIAPTGTHHTVLALGGLSVGSAIYASGVDTNALTFPDGVGLKVSQGLTLILQLHLFNPSGQTITGTSGIEIIEVAPEDVVQEADIFLPGPLQLAIPPNQVFTQTANCTVSTAQTVFAIFPHMHQLGSHFKTTVTVGGVPQVLHDDDYDFTHQPFVSFEPVALAPGDSITTECTWNNTTPGTVTWGESSTTEMCFSILYRYPAQSDQGFCDN